MKQRHLLLRRQRGLFPQLFSRQPLTAYITRRQDLARTLGLSETNMAQAEQAVERVVQPWWLLRVDRLPVPASDQFEDEAAPGTPALPESRLEGPVPAANLLKAEDVDLSAQLPQAHKPAQVPVRTTEEIHQPEVEVSAPQPQIVPVRAEEAEPPARAELVRPTHLHIIELQESAGPQALPAFTKEAEARIDENSSGTGDLKERVFPSARETFISKESSVSHDAREMPTPEETTSASRVAGEQQLSTELFAPGGTDRSPQSWLARLNRREQRTGRQEVRPASPPEPRNTLASKSIGPLAQGQKIRSAEPMSQNARAFLKPLLGIDPTAVPIYRDARAAEDTLLAQADALSNGEAIEIAPEYSAQTPETLALFAHELTHVVRQQNPRFIPPVALAELPASSWETRDEEALALHVERQTRQLARDAPVTGVTRAVQPAIQQREPDMRALTPGVARPIWGNLPAPWEPLPDWLTPTSFSQDASVSPGAELSAVAPLSAPDESSREGVSEVRRAGLERSIEQPDDGATSSTYASSSPELTRAPEPDLDALARQVYGLLKRRLSVEQRREL